MATVTLAGLHAFLTARMDKTLVSAAMFDRMGASLLASVRQGIQAEQAPDGSKWAPLKPATVKKRGSAHPILRMRGDLYRSIVYHHDKEHAQVGAHQPYARIHQFGGRAGRGANIPARPYLFNNDGTAPPDWKEPLVKIFLQSLKSSLGGA